MHRYLQENKLVSIQLQDQGNSMNRRGHINNKNKIDINKKHNGLTDKIDRTTDDRMVIGNYFKNFNKECKLMGNLEGWGYVQMPVEHNYADLYLLITPEGGQMISLLYYNLYIINITNNLAHMYRGDICVHPALTTITISAATEWDMMVLILTVDLYYIKWDTMVLIHMRIWDTSI